MMHPRWLALPLAALTGSATITGLGTGCASGPAPRLLSPELHIGTLDQRTRFELDDRGSAPAAEREAPDDEGEADTPKQQRRRKLLYYTGLGAMGFGALGFVSFGLGGRIVQAQLKNGYEDGDLDRDREDQLTTTGKVMNGLTIGTAVVGLLGLITAATVYGIDHARCGELRPRRKDCPDQGVAEPAPAQGAEPAPTDEAATNPADSSAEPTEVGPAPAGPSSTPAGPSGASAEVGPAPAPGPTPAPSPRAAAGQ